MRSEVRGSLERHLPRSLPTEDELFAMRQAAWRKQGIVVLRIDDFATRSFARPFSTRRRGSTAGGRWRDGPAQAEEPRHVMSPACRSSSATTTSSNRCTRPIPTARPVVHHRTVDTLGIMLRAGTITKDMHDAARDFQAQFTVARFDVVRCMPLIRLPGGRRSGDLTDAQVDARRRVGEALDALGGLGSPAGSCVWHVVGLQRSIREWAMRQGWGGRPVRVEQAQGILVAALGVLARHYGYQQGGRVADGR